MLAFPGPMVDSPPPSVVSRRRVGGVLRLFISLALLAILAFFVVDVPRTMALLRGIRLDLALLLLVVNTTAYALFAWRWGYFCRRLGLILPRGGYLRGIYLLQVTSQVVPSPLLGEAGRFAAFPPGTRKRDILKSIALDRLSNQIALVGCVALLVPYYWGLALPRGLHWLLLLPPLVLVAGFFLARRLGASHLHERHPWLGRLRFLRLLAAERFGLVPLGMGVGLCLVLGLEFLLAARALPLSAPAPATLALLIPLLSLLLAVAPVSVGDWGTRELIAVLVLPVTGLAAEDIVAASLLVGVTNLVCSLPGLYFIARPGDAPRALPAEHPEED